MAEIHLQAVIKDGVLRFYEETAENCFIEKSSWYIEHQPLRRAWALFRNQNAGTEKLVNRYYTIEAAYEAAQELT